MTAPQDVEIAESLQQQLKFFADTEMVLRSDLEALERKLRRTRLVASFAVASALLLPVVLRFVPLSTKRLVTRELVVETDRGGSLRVGSTETESSLRFQHRDKPALVITASDQEHRMQLSAFDEKAEGIVLSSRADRTSVSLSHEPQSDGSSNRVVLVSDAEGGRVEARGSAGAAVLGGRVPSVSLSSPGSTLTASADDHAKLELSKKDAGSITLAATDKGPRLTLARKFVAELFVTAADAGLQLKGDGPSELLLSANHDGKGPLLRGRHPEHELIANRDGIRVSQSSGGKTTEAVLSASKGAAK